MISITIRDMQGGQKGSINLSEDIFAVSGKKSILYDVVRMQRSNSRQGNASTKNRAEVNKTGKKPWKQKGTGRARAGSAGSPIWKGGGIVFGPRPRDYSYALPKKVRELAVKMALSEKLKSNEIVIVEDIKMPEIKTKNFCRILKNLQLENDNILIVLQKKDENIIKSTRNLPKLRTITAECLNVYDILRADKILITKDALNKVQEVIS
ncbi:MAG: 50S ribosomal protein L4 [Candidatus Firestonebacteria bacterium]|nr:50S ribosomal protein L4 [Candidatus Firestonebacteria bacterium]